MTTPRSYSYSRDARGVAEQTLQPAAEFAAGLIMDAVQDAQSDYDLPQQHGGRGGRTLYSEVESRRRGANVKLVLPSILMLARSSSAPECHDVGIRFSERLTVICAPSVRVP
jgi:hypothetical protein